MSFENYRYFVRCDLFRVVGDAKLASFVHQLMLGGSFKYIFWMRTCMYAKHNAVLKLLLYPPARMILRRYVYKFGIDIPFTTAVGKGLFIGHFGGIVVHPKTIIGNNCNLSQGVTIGQANRGKNAGYATIGDNTYIGPGAKIVGSVMIGDNAAIGANCVVTKDVPNGAVVAGVPGKIISYKGSTHYVHNTGYEGML